jgi:hypothetical protein
MFILTSVSKRATNEMLECMRSGAHESRPAGEVKALYPNYMEASMPAACC